MATSESRNARCACGSGKKHKNCCGVNKGKTNPPKKNLLIYSVLGIALVLVLALFLLKENDAVTPAAGVDIPGSTAPGPPPPGKVWSVEHGHWHDL